MPVSTPKKEYTEACANWDLVDDIVNNDAKKHLRDVDKTNPIRNKQYKDFGVLTNFTRLTLEGLTGLVFRKDLKVNLPPELEYLLEDATGGNITLDQLVTKVVWELIKKGRYGLLADASPVEGSTARIKPYDCKAIINWGSKQFDDEYKLNLVVLKECVDYLAEDGFTWIEDYQFRVLRLSDDQVYYQEIWNSDDELVRTVEVLDYNGNTLDEIPFIFLGSENNDGCVDNPPMLDLAILNLSHYRNSCDTEETSFLCGQLQPVTNIGDMDYAAWQQANPEGIKLGSLSNIIVNTGGDFNFRQGQPNIMPRQLQQDKEAQAAAIGARLIAPPGGRETAEGVRIRYGAQNSRLFIITKNVDLAMKEIFEWCAEFMMETPVDSEFELNDVFYEDTVDPNELVAQMQMFDRRIVTAEEIRTNAKKAGMLLDDNYTADPADVNPIDQMDMNNSNDA